MTPYIGILLNGDVAGGIAKGRTKQEALAFYEEAGKAYGLTPCYFTLADVDLPSASVRAYVLGAGGYSRRKLPIPKVIHNRALLFGKLAKRRLSRLAAAEGVALFNRSNRYSKLLIHRILLDEPNLHPHLPVTCVGNRQNLQEMKQRYDKLILKPASSSIGLGVMMLEKHGAVWSLSYRPPRGRWTTTRNARTIEAVIRRAISRKTYLVQQYLPLARYEGRPFDLRVSVQRGETGEWGITGIVGKVAAKRRFVTNVARGGRVHTMEEILASMPGIDPVAARERIADVSLRVAYALDRELPGLADLGLDIGLAEDGTPMFIECNGRDQRYSFRKGGLLEEFRSTYANPIAYGGYLLHRRDG